MFVMTRSQLFSQLELERLKIYWDHLLDEISSNPVSFCCLTYTSAPTTSKRSQVKQSRQIVDVFQVLKFVVF